MTLPQIAKEISNLIDAIDIHNDERVRLVGAEFSAPERMQAAVAVAYLRSAHRALVDAEIAELHTNANLKPPTS